MKRSKKIQFKHKHLNYGKFRCVNKLLYVRVNECEFVLDMFKFERKINWHLCYIFGRFTVVDDEHSPLSAPTSMKNEKMTGERMYTHTLAKARHKQITAVGRQCIHIKQAEIAAIIRIYRFVLCSCVIRMLCVLV